MSISGVQIYKKTEFLVGESPDQVAGDILIARPSWERKAMIIGAFIATLGIAAGATGAALGLLHIIPIAGSGTLVITGAVFTATDGVVVFTVVIRRKLFERTVMKCIDKQNKLINDALGDIARREERVAKEAKRAERKSSRGKGKKEAPKISKAEEKIRENRAYVKGLESDLHNLIIKDEESLFQQNGKKILHVYGRDAVEGEDDAKQYQFNVYFYPNNKIKNAIKNDLKAAGAKEEVFSK